MNVPEHLPPNDLSSEGQGRTSQVVKKNVDVAIIGNGPSGIFLSLLLSGYRPYFKGFHPDPFLNYRLKQHPNKSILDQDLQYLSEGLEGRSKNQVAVLLDNLLHPNVDIGETHPSTLYWKYHPSKAVSHVVIGAGQPGGSWHGMKADIETLSLGSWLELPVYTFQDWRADSGSKVKGESLKRVTLGSVAQYYTDYVSRMGLDGGVVNNMLVTKVRHVEPSPRVRCTIGSPSPCRASPDPEVFSQTVPCMSPTQDGPLFMHTVDSGVHLSEYKSSCTRKTSTEFISRESSPDVCCWSDSDDIGVYCNASTSGEYNWCLKGTRTTCSSDNSEYQGTIVCAKNLVLACGVGEKARKLKVSGEDAPFITYQFSDFCDRLNRIDQTQDWNPILIVGAGLSAADAILHATSKGLNVIHVFRKDPNDPSLVYHKMPKAVYPEYARVLSLMRREELVENYTPMSRSQVCEFKNESVCVVENEVHERTLHLVSLVGVFIGSESELGFLPENVATRLGVNQDLPIHSKTNPVDVDPLTFESESFSSLYALGPLVGDNFVRFVLGSGLGACKHLTEKLQGLHSSSVNL